MLGLAPVGMRRGRRYPSLWIGLDCHSALRDLQRSYYGVSGVNWFGNLFGPAGWGIGRILNLPFDILQLAGWLKDPKVYLPGCHDGKLDFVW